MAGGGAGEGRDQWSARAPASAEKSAGRFPIVEQKERCQALPQALGNLPKTLTEPLT